MSKLYIRIRTGFYSHRKTAKLRAMIGDDALWIPPRLWAYAAESQPDGNMGSYGSEELALLLGCPKHSSSIREALLGAGFLDPDGMIHNWSEHNGYHHNYAERARTAALTRWENERARKEKKQKKGSEIGNRKVESGDKHCLKNASPMLGASETEIEASFDRFWAEYPRKIAKVNALKAWKKPENECHQNIELIISEVKRQRRDPQWVKDDHQFAPHPATWLNGKRWQDGAAPSKTSIAPVIPSELPPEILAFDFKAELDAKLAREAAERQ